MIIDTMTNLCRYAALYPELGRVAAALERNRFQSPGDLEGLVCNHMRRKTTATPATVLEYHREHLDLHLVFSGRERIAWSPCRPEREVPREPVQDDCVLVRGEGAAFCLDPGMFCLLLPYELHMPLLAVDEPELVTKTVVKIHRHMGGSNEKQV